MTASLNGAVVIVPSSELRLHQVYISITIPYSNIVDAISGVLVLVFAILLKYRDNTALMVLKKCYRDVRWRLM